MKYKFITIEGNIGAGKTSLATRIAKDYQGDLILERFAENTFLPKFYEDPDNYAFPLEMSFLADRYQQLKEILTQSSLFSSFTISDYFIDKSLIFARKTLDSDEYGLYRKLFEIITSPLPKPDLLVFLHLNVSNLEKNIRNRGRDYEKNISHNYLEKIQNSYLEFIKQNQNMRILIVDTNHIDFVKSDDDYKLMIDIIKKDYSPGIHRVQPK